ncbi:MAG: D-aminoacylase [Actinomycetota bacterium]
MTGTRLLIHDGSIVDGSGGAPFRGSVVVEGTRIAAVLPEGAPVPSDLERIDAAGRALCPGFIDVHTHSDLSPFVEPWMDSALRQGITTVVVGNCGASPWPVAGAPEMAVLTGVEPASIPATWPGFGAYLAAVDACHPALNVAALVGHGAVRQEILGTERRPPDPAELGRMRSVVREAMADGAAGLSTGLVYIPGMYANTDEIVALAEETSRHGGVYASHIRGEGVLLFDSVREAIEIGRRAGVPTHVSHLKLEGAGVWGRGTELLELLDRAREDGHDTTADQYPYTAWESELWSLLPPWAPPEALTEVLADPSERDRLEHAVAEGEPGWQSSIDGVGWDRIIVSTHSGDASTQGRSIADIARERGTDPFDAATALLVADRDTGVIGHAMREEDVRQICARNDVLVASDSTAMSPAGPLGAAPVHPRTYGTFPRVLGPYVREGVLSLTAAVRKMTALPAERFGLVGRGTIAAGSFADLVLLDPSRVADRAGFGAPHAFPDGIDLVMVGGATAWSAAQGNGERVGRTLKRGGSPTA